MSKAEDLAKELYPDWEMTGVSTVDGLESLMVRIQRVAYIKGYNQAEKDLLENKHEKSWRLDEKLWEGIKDTEEASYQYTYDASNDWAYDVPTWEDVQDAFKTGSEWKEDLALTIEDIKTIDRLLNKCVDCSDPYQEVLKRFKGLKHVK